MRLRKLRARFVLVAATSAALTVAVVLTFALRARHVVIADTQRKTLSTVEAFAQATEAWISKGDLDTVSRVADLMLSGSSLYVEVVHGNAVLVERIEPSWQGPLPTLQTSSPLSEPSSRFRRDHSLWYVDVHIPLTTEAIPRGTGYVRAGIDISFARARITASTLRAAGVGALVWVACCAASFFALTRRSGVSEQQRDCEATILKYGGLTIDSASVEVALDGKPVRLTPKQFGLLTLLATAQGRVVSDQEIVERLWPESRYADSNDVRQCVYKLRRRMNSVQSGAGNHIHNVKGFGYRLLGAEPATARKPIEQRPLRPQVERRKGEGGRNE